MHCDMVFDTITYPNLRVNRALVKPSKTPPSLLTLFIYTSPALTTERKIMSQQLEETIHAWSEPCAITVLNASSEPKLLSPFLRTTPRCIQLIFLMD